MNKFLNRCMLFLLVLVLMNRLYEYYYRNKNDITTTEKVPYPVLYKDVTPQLNGNNIYIIETSKRPYISGRYLCAVESHCKTNPDGTVYFLVLVDTLNAATYNALEEMKRTYGNLQVLKVDVPLVMKDTPMANVTHKKGWDTSINLITNLCDVIRVPLIYKSGGFYSDTDNLAVRSVTQYKNFLVKQEEDHVASASFHFDAKHPFMYQTMISLAKDLILDAYGTGVLPYTTALQIHCPSYKSGKTTGFNEELLDSATCTEVKFEPPQSIISCADVKLFDPNAYYMVHWSHLDRLFRMTEKELCMSTLMKNGLGIHWGNSIAKGMWAYPDSTIETYSQRYCPITYHWNGIKGLFSVPEKFK